MDFGDYEDYPFDKLNFMLKIEFSKFTIPEDPNITYYVDIYRCPDELTVKSQVDGCPDMYYDHRGSIIDVEPDKWGNFREIHYPVVKFKMMLSRDPMSIVYKTFFPTILLGIFLARCTFIEELGDRLNNVSVALVAFIVIFGEIRMVLPQLKTVSTAEKFCIVFIFASLIPICQPEPKKHATDPEKFDPDHLNEWWFFIAYCSFCFIPVLYMICKICISKIRLSRNKPLE